MAGYRSDPPADPNNPRARGRCDRCDFVGFRDELRWEMRYAGDRLVRNGLLVCPRCLDVPQPQDRVIILPVDPEPVRDPRPEPPIDP